MGRIELGFMAAGSALMTAGAAIIHWPAALCVAGALIFAAGFPRGGSA